jgi:hypothetical protein
MHIPIHNLKADTGRRELLMASESVINLSGRMLWILIVLIILLAVFAGLIATGVGGAGFIRELLLGVFKL